MIGVYFGGKVSGAVESFVCHHGRAEAVLFEVEITGDDPLSEGKSFSQTVACIAQGNLVEEARSLVRAGRYLVFSGSLRVVGAAKQIPGASGLSAAAVKRDFVLVLSTIMEPGERGDELRGEA